MQLWHGTQDTTLAYPNFGEEIKQWTNVLGVSQTPVFTDNPSGWTRTRYGSNSTMAPVEAISVPNVGHSLPLSGQAAMAIAFFGLNTTPPTSAPPTTSRPPTSAPPTSTPPTTRPPTSAPPTTGAPGTCTALGVVQTQWSTGYVVQPVNITNNGSTTMNGWTVTFTLPAGHTLSGSWNATVTVSGQTVTARNVSYNGTIGAGQTRTDTFGFQATRPNGNTALPSGWACTSP
jgi:hypothetical protein